MVVILTTESRSSETSNVCTNKSNGYAVNNPSECRAYWRCQNGQAIANNCPIGYNFNEAAQLCDLPENYPCSDADEDSDSIEDGNDGDDDGNDSNEDDDVHRCPPDGIYAYAQSGSCVDFNFCYAGFHMVRQCADGLHFDAAIGQCNYAHLANCHRDVCPSVNDPDNIVVWPSPTDCEAYEKIMTYGIMTFEL